MARLDQQPHIRIHKRHRHRNIHAIGQHRTTIGTPVLDEAEDVIPPTAVEACRMRTELEQDLLHMESCWQRLDQDCGANGSRGDVEVGLGKVEDVVPEACFEVVFHLQWDI
jgi:hypothetical protein